jgi:hypothetical protein
MLAESLSDQSLSTPAEGGGRFQALLLLSFEEALKTMLRFFSANRCRMVAACGMG